MGRRRYTIAATTGHGMHYTPSYIIFNEGGFYQALNCTTGIIEFSDPIAITVLDDVHDALVNGGVICFKAGTYTITARWDITNDGITIIGEGTGQTALQWVGNVGGIRFDSVVYCGIGRISLYGPGATGGHGLHLLRTTGSSLRFHGFDLWVSTWQGANQAALCIEGCQMNRFENCLFTYSYHGAYILEVAGPIRSNLNKFDGCDFTDNLDTAILIEDSYNNSFIGCDIENNNEMGMVLGEGPTAIVGTILIDCWFEGNNQDADPATYDLHVVNAAHTHLIDCRFNSVNSTLNLQTGAWFFGVCHGNFFGQATRFSDGVRDVDCAGNQFVGVITVVAGHTVRFRVNGGFIAYEEGTATIVPPAAVIVVAHGLSQIPTNIHVTPINLDPGQRYWVSAIGAANFSINTTAAPAGNRDFMWSARYRP